MNQGFDVIYNKICLMLPTYGRRYTYLPAFIESALSTAGNLSNVCFAFCVNKNDAETLEFLKMYKFDGRSEIIEENLTNPNLSVYFNMIFNSTRTKTEPGTIVSQLGDDMVFRTQGWDRKFLDLINFYKGVGVFWCDDDFIAHERCPVNLFLSRQFVEATEHPFMCELFQGDMIDYVWGKVGKYTRTSHYLTDVHIWHNHNCAKPIYEQDQTHKRLMPFKIKAHEVGKVRAKQVAHEIADVLIRKGLTGDSIC